MDSEHIMQSMWSYRGKMSEILIFKKYHDGDVTIHSMCSDKA